jgi:hypothetical protein
LLAAHAIETIDALEDLSDTIIETANVGGGPEIYESFAKMQRVVIAELAWLDSIEPDVSTAATTLDTYESTLATLRGLLDTILNGWVGVPPAGDFEGPEAEQAGSTLGDLLGQRLDLRSMQGGFALVPPIVTPSASPIPVDYEELRVTIREVVEEDLEFFIDRVEKVTVSAEEIEVEIGDSNWVRDILQEHQWSAIQAIADEIYGFGDYWGNITPRIVLRSNSALGGGALISRTDSGLLMRIYDFEAGESDWDREADFDVRGRLY